MNFYIPFIDEFVRDAKESPVETNIGDAYVIARPMGWQGMMGVKQRIYEAFQVLRGKAVAMRYMQSEADLQEARARYRRTK